MLSSRSAFILRGISDCALRRSCPRLFAISRIEPPAESFYHRHATRRSHNLSSKMATSTTITQDGLEHRTITEGKATVLVPQGAKIGEESSEVQQVFYNPIQQFNRDLSVLAIKAYGDQVLEKKRQHIQRLDKKQRKRKRDHDDVGNEKRADNEGVEPTSQSEPSNPQPKQIPFRILDALSASGLRALRYAHEIPFVTDVTANDLSASASKAIAANVTHNGLEDKINVTNNDALALMYRTIADTLSVKDVHEKQKASHKWDVIDLDPYGTAAPFIDAAVQAVRDDGGLLCVTCTDSAIWAGHSYPEKTFSLYGGTPAKATHSHEVGLRLILNSIASSAGRYGLDIEPLLSLSIDYYVKVFVRVTKSPSNVKFLGAKTMMVYSCDTGCGAFQTQPLMRSKVAPNKKGSGFFYKHVTSQGPLADHTCAQCGAKTHMNGPMYGGRLHSPDFVKKLLENIDEADPKVYGTLPRLKGMVQTALEEYIPDAKPLETGNPKEDAAAAIEPYPFYIIPQRLSGTISCSSPPDDMVRGALIHLGYRITRSHCKAGSIKTDAPWSTIWWIMTEWVRQKAPIKPSKYKPTMPGYKILKDAGLLDTDETQAPTNGETSAGEEDSKMEDLGKPVGQHEQANDNAKEGTKTADESQAPVTEEELRKTLVFDEVLARIGREGDSKQGLVRYQVNPESNWGPLSRAKAN